MTAARGIRRTARVAAAAAIAMASVAVMAGPAQAANVYAKCTAGGDALNTDVFYYRSGSYWMVDTSTATISNNLATKNNLYVRVRNNGGANEYWAWTSGDNIKGGQTYSFTILEEVPRSGKPYVKTNAIFDQTGSDPNCSTYMYMV